jgi:hypothetical protein
LKPGSRPFRSGWSPPSAGLSGSRGFSRAAIRACRRLRPEVGREAVRNEWAGAMVSASRAHARVGREIGLGSPKPQVPRGNRGVPNGKPKADKIKRVIFVFAGGVYSSFEKFDPRAVVPGEDVTYGISEKYREEIRKFANKKGPDFISRLRGHINVPEANADPGHSKHFLRRAIQLRGLLEGKVFFAEKNKFAQVDEALIYALLTVDRYRHGIRSMEAVLRMCTPRDQSGQPKRLYISSLPSRPQLNMHVDAEEFFVRLHRGRSRMEPGLANSRSRKPDFTRARTRCRNLRAFARAPQLNRSTGTSKRTLCYTKARSGGGPHAGVRIHL